MNNCFNRTDYYAYHAGHMIPMMSPNAGFPEYTVYDSVTAGSAGYTSSDQYIPTNKYVHDWVSSWVGSNRFTTITNKHASINTVTGGFKECNKLVFVYISFKVSSGIAVNQPIFYGNLPKPLISECPLPIKGNGDRSIKPTYEMRVSYYNGTTSIYTGGQTLDATGQSTTSSIYVICGMYFAE